MSADCEATFAVAHARRINDFLNCSLLFVRKRSCDYEQWGVSTAPRSCYRSRLHALQPQWHVRELYETKCSDIRARIT